MMQIKEKGILRSILHSLFRSIRVFDPAQWHVPTLILYVSKSISILQDSKKNETGEGGRVNAENNQADIVLHKLANDQQIMLKTKVEHMGKIKQDKRKKKAKNNKWDTTAQRL